MRRVIEVTDSKNPQLLEYEEILSDNVMRTVKKRYESRIITLKISDELFKELTYYKNKYGYNSRSDFIRDAIKIYIRLLNLLENNSPVTLDAKIRNLSEVVEKFIRSICKISKS
ncbi:MAG: ribbon-helix-helix domain-containing protein [Sulfolobales archaeon]